MSDFDREAERERLREKYERDREEREVTEQMSELLLQGATMTNAHCSACGNPIFRYDGQEFCPTCERPVDRGDGADGADRGPDEADAGDGEDGAADVEMAAPSDDTRVVFGDAGDREQSGADTQTRRAETGEQPDRDGQVANSGGSPRDVAEPAEGTDATRGAGSAHDVTAPARSPGEQGADTSGADIGSARASLVRTLVAFSRRAEAADDPREAREHLQAAREAAETLAALR